MSTANFKYRAPAWKECSWLAKMPAGRVSRLGPLLAVVRATIGPVREKAGTASWSGIALLNRCRQGLSEQNGRGDPEGMGSEFPALLPNCDRHV
jgi:hypothetical protein